MSKLRLSVAVSPNDRVQAILDGSVGIEGCDPILLPLRAEEAFHRALSGAQFDVTEMSLSSYLLGLSRGHRDYVAIPIFPSRSFRHSGIYVRTDRGISSPQNLAGKLVGVPEYQMTAAVWIRGLLSDGYGVAPSQIRWRTGGLEQPGRKEKIPLDLGPGVEIRSIASDESLSAMLAAGELDAVISARAPSSFDHGRRVDRLFRDAREVEERYFRETGVFPIMHVVVLRHRLADAHPWLAQSLFKAFDKAKSRALEKLAEVGSLGIALPWLQHELARTRDLMGEDFWPYGVGPNLHVLETLARYAYEQGLTARPVAVTEMFVPYAGGAIRI